MDQTVELGASSTIPMAANKAISAYGWKTLAATIIGNAMDGLDMLLLAFMLPAISAALSLTGAEAGTIVTVTLVGAVLGGLGFGVLSDYYGRVRVMTWSIVLFAVFTGLCGLAQGYTDLLIYRFIAGLGLGGEWGIGMALIAEAWPADKRARATSYVALGWSLGVLLATFAAASLLPIVGWRGLFFVGVIPAFVAFAIRHTLHEPELFVTKSRAERTTFPLATFFADAKTTKASVGIFILCAVQNFGYFGVMIWMPSYLARTFGFRLTQSATWTAVTILGMMLGGLCFGHLADRIGRRPTFLLYQVGAVVMVFIYSQLTDPLLLLVGGGIMGVFVNGMTGGYGALMAEVYPTQSRGTAQSTLWNLGRAVGGFSPLVIGAIAASYSFSTAIALLALVYLLDVAATLFLIPELKGAALK